MRLQILIPQYKETEEIIKPLLDSIEIQQSVDLKNEVGVIIVNDGTDIHLSKEFLDKYTYHIDYYLNEHKGVSATRNACLDYAIAEYVMFCDADDMFYSACGLYIIFQEIENGFDTLVSKFIEEVRDKDTNKPIYINHEIDSTFVHGKVHNREFLIKNNIRWDEELTLHEDGYFHAQCHRLAKSIKHCKTSFYLWKWRDDSVCRSEKLWSQKTYDHLIKAVSKLIDNFLSRKKIGWAQFYFITGLREAYVKVQMPEWQIYDDIQHKEKIIRDIANFYHKYKSLYDNASENAKEKLLYIDEKKLALIENYDSWISFSEWLNDLEKYLEHN